jgi:REP element-mobilizing transposase RayT
MARKLRIQYPGAIYHVMNRGDRSEPLVRDAVDRERFLATLAEACEKATWRIHAYCLMPNHFHLIVETPQGNLATGMKWFLGTYTSRFNHRHRLCGHLFSGRYKALPVDGSGNGYLKTVCDYVHLNPARAKLVAEDRPLREYPWSSFPEYLKDPRKRFPWLRIDRLLGEYHIPKDSGAGRIQFERALEAHRLEGRKDTDQLIRRAWYWGDEAFKQELLERMEGRAGAHHFGEERAETQEAQAERILRAELQRRKWTEADLVRRRKGDLEKVRLAQRLREQTMMTLSWLVQRLHMGSAAYLNNRLFLLRQGALD